DIIILYPDNSIALCSKVGFSSAIVGNLAIFRMSCTVDLNDEARLPAKKVDNVRADWNLPDKFEILQPAPAEIAPQPVFRRHIGSAKGACALDLSAWCEGHDASYMRQHRRAIARRPSSALRAPSPAK